jgi:very-short-patch-repair endonuclease
MPAKRDKSGQDAEIASIATRRHGVVTRAQLVAAGVSESGISDRVAAGRLHRVHRGVYAVGHPRLSDHGRWMAAVLACGEGAVLSHLSAAELWGLRRRARRLSEAGGRGAPDPVHITVPSTAGKRKQRGIVLHRSSTLTASDCTRHDGIPVTKPRRTLADIRPLLSPTQFNSAVREAEFLRLPIGDWFGGGPEPAGEPPRSGRRRAAHLRDRARTELEQRMLALCRRHRLPQPEVNVTIDRFEVDFLWREQRLVVEVDGWESHRSRSAFEEDRARDARLAFLGYEVVRFTWRQLARDGTAVATTIRSLLRLRGSDRAA